MAHRTPRLAPPTRVRHAIVTATTAIVVAALVGCDHHGPGPATPSAAERTEQHVEKAITAAVTTYTDALLARDFTTACRTLTPETVTALLATTTTPNHPVATCIEAFGVLYSHDTDARQIDVLARTLHIQDITVSGDTAAITYRTQSSDTRVTFMGGARLIDDDWRLVDIP